MNNLPPPTSLQMKDCWAKTDESGEAALGVKEHCLHVGAVAEELLARLPVCDSLPSGASFLIAAHDIGKISPGFLMKSPSWRAQWQELLGLTAPQDYESRHAWVSQSFLSSKILNPPDSLIALGGHHGSYLCNQARPLQLGAGKVGCGVFEDLRNELLDFLRAEFGSLPNSEKIPKGARLHWFTGAMIFSDWIGSNTTWFPLGQPPICKKKAKQKASCALDQVFPTRVGMDRLAI